MYSTIRMWAPCSSTAPGAHMQQESDSAGSRPACPRLLFSLLRFVTLGGMQALEALAAAPGVSVIDDRGANRFPMPLDATNNDDVYVGRVRRDISRADQKGLDLWVCGDQIKKGAALNAVQIAELLL